MWFIIANRLSIHNLQSKSPTFIKQMNEGSTRKSHIYLTLTSEKAEQMIFNWRIVKCKFKTEHQLIPFEMDAPSSDCLSRTPSVRYDFEKSFECRLGESIGREVFCFLTGHGPFVSHSCRFNHHLPENCRFCGLFVETADHLLRHCAALGRFTIDQDTETSAIEDASLFSPKLENCKLPP